MVYRSALRVAGSVFVRLLAEERDSDEDPALDIITDHRRTVSVGGRLQYQHTYALGRGRIRSSQRWNWRTAEGADDLLVIETLAYYVPRLT